MWKREKKKEIDDAKSGWREKKKRIKINLDCDKRPVIRTNLLIFICYINFDCVSLVLYDKRRLDLSSSFNLFAYLLIVFPFREESMFTATYFSSACRGRQPHSFTHSFKWCWCTHLEHLVWCGVASHFSLAYASLATKYAIHEIFFSILLCIEKFKTIPQLILTSKCMQTVNFLFSLSLSPYRFLFCGRRFDFCIRLYFF